MTAEQQLKKLDKIYLGTVTQRFHTRTVLIVAKGSVTALDFLPDDRQVVVWCGHPPFSALSGCTQRCIGVRAAHEGPFRHLALIHPNNLTMGILGGSDHQGGGTFHAAAVDEALAGTLWIRLWERSIHANNR